MLLSYIIFHFTVEDFRKIYLFLYNLSQFIGFLYVLIVLSIRYAKEGPGKLNFQIFSFNKTMN